MKMAGREFSRARRTASTGPRLPRALPAPPILPLESRMTVTCLNASLTVVDGLPKCSTCWSTRSELIDCSLIATCAREKSLARRDSGYGIGLFPLISSIFDPGNTFRTAATISRRN